MCALHAARPMIIHRDLKSMNFLVDENYRIKVADFGLAKVRTFSRTVRSVAGTYMWMAPETMEGKPYDEKVDVYSFGLVIWELVTGELPFREYTNDVALARAVVDFRVRPKIPYFCPQQLAELIEDCWHHNPRRRPSFETVVSRLYDMLRVTRGERFQFSDPLSAPNSLTDVSALSLPLSLSLSLSLSLLMSYSLFSPVSVPSLSRY
eukprot:TRINITY_DN2330_c0_g1_i1.p1 TRINITY_DN2330_c0_g1~~TRINITY_DN2330_c0_g1_i1.p1  ORF type:complete len:207 (+),score=30.59 TRINITY_DN2330_c0_g1_i1:272-892(+)